MLHNNEHNFATAFIFVVTHGRLIQYLARLIEQQFWNVHCIGDARQELIINHVRDVCYFYGSTCVLYQFNEKETGKINFSRHRERARHRKLIKHKLKVTGYSVFVFFSCWINQKQKKSHLCCCWATDFFLSRQQMLLWLSLYHSFPGLNRYLYCTSHGIFFCQFAKFRILPQPFIYYSGARFMLCNMQKRVERNQQTYNANTHTHIKCIAKKI